MYPQIFDPTLLKYLACPMCKSDLELIANKIICRNNKCEAEYIIKDGIPILLPPTQISNWAKDQQGFFDDLVKNRKNTDTLELSLIDKFFDHSSYNHIKQFIYIWLKLIQPSSLLLDCGCGSGTYTQLMASVNKNILIIGMDISFENIKKASDMDYQSNMDSTNKVYFIVADINFIPFRPNSFHAISVINILHHLHRPQKTLQELSECLIQKGYILNVEITSNNPLNNLSRKLFPIMPAYSKKSMVKDLVVDGKIPETNIFKGKTFENYLLASNLQVIKTESYNLILFIIRYISKVVPIINQVISCKSLAFLYKIEQKIILSRFFGKFCVVVMYISKKR